MSERKSISTIVGKRGGVVDLYLRLPTTNEPDAIRHDQIVLARVSNGAAVAFIDRDGLYDRDGNFFYNDI